VMSGLVAGFGAVAVAGYGIGARLEMLQIPIAFGFGAALVPMVGMNVGAGQIERARRIALIGSLLAGAISGVIGTYLMLHPHATIRTLVLRFIVPLPAWVVLGLWIGLQVFNVYIAPPGEGGGVAWWAHIGGFVAGVILIVPFRWRDVPLFDRGENHPVINRTIIPRSGKRP